MRYAGNFHPEWGYLAPAPSFLRTVRIAIVATAVGATAGAGVVFALVDRPAAEISVAARTLVPSVAPAPISASAPAQLAPHAAQISDQPAKPAAEQGGASSASEASTPSTVHLPAGSATLAEAPPVTDAPVQIREQAATATNAPPAQKKATRKRRATSPYAWRAEPPNGGERVPFSLRRLFDQAPNNGRWANDGYARAGGWDARRDGYYPARDW
jgi:hypothetical protein